MKKKLSFTQQLVFLVLFLVDAFFVGDLMWLLFYPDQYQGVWSQIRREIYEKKAPAWVTDERLAQDAVDDIWGDAGALSDSKVVIYTNDEAYLRKEYYDCSAALYYDDGRFTLRVYSYPWGANELCFRWAEKLESRVYRGTITVVGDQKIIHMERDRAFRPEIVLVPTVE